MRRQIVSTLYNKNSYADVCGHRKPFCFVSNQWKLWPPGWRAYYLLLLFFFMFFCCVFLGQSVLKYDKRRIQEGSWWRPHRENQLSIIHVLSLDEQCAQDRQWTTNRAKWLFASFGRKHVLFSNRTPSERMEQGKSQVQGKEKTTKTLEKRSKTASSQRSADSNRELRFVFSVTPPAAIASRIFYGISDVTRITLGVSFVWLCIRHGYQCFDWFACHAPLWLQRWSVGTSI